ncbi:MAG TPA: nitronate monooxygenase [Bdellovibrionota bacterium]|jgi:nitronate monooxygenase|nr:nitronate monooxygenase [Bdellovibrionota bacterium]
MTEKTSPPIQTSFTKLLGCRYPVIAGPMFLVSDENLVAAVSNAGGVGAAPSLNWRDPEAFREAVRKIKSMTDRPFGINIIVNQANPRVAKDLDVCAEEKVPLVITSLGSPKEVIRRMHEVGGKVFCDVTTLGYAKKVEEMGADGVIAVSAGAGGHAGPTSPLVLVPYLRRHLRIPVVLAGGIATGDQMAAAMMLGAAAVQIGTRFIATHEAKVDDKYKQAVVNAEPEDIVLTKKLSGTPAAVIRTPYIDRQGLELNPIESFLMKRKSTKKLMKTIRFLIGSRMLEKAAMFPTWKEVWSAGQGVGLIEEILPAGEVVRRLVAEYYAAVREFDPEAPSRQI